MLLDQAGYLALRGLGRVEPNPMVGCVIFKQGRVIGIGHHRVFGGPHAEVEALADANDRGHDARDADVFVTLEPCNGQGKQPPCTEALLRAGVRSVMYARSDPNPSKAGGAAWLCSHGIECKLVGHEAFSVVASAAAAPFIKRVTTGLPWVIGKWAQSRSGSLTQGDDGSRWISNEASRRRVHKLRSRVDAIVTGIGTVLMDDPLLTVRNINKPRRNPLRVVLDSQFRLPLTSRLAQTLNTAKTIIYGLETENADLETRSRRDALSRAGVAVRCMRMDAATSTRVDIAEVLRSLHQQSGVQYALVEAGTTVLGACFERGLIDQAVVYFAGLPPREVIDRCLGLRFAGELWTRLQPADGWMLAGVKEVGTDTELTLIRSDRLRDTTRRIF